MSTDPDFVTKMGEEDQATNTSAGEFTSRLSATRKQPAALTGRRLIRYLDAKFAHLSVYKDLVNEALIEAVGKERFGKHSSI